MQDAAVKLGLSKLQGADTMSVKGQKQRSIFSCWGGASSLCVTLRETPEQLAFDFGDMREVEVVPEAHALEFSMCEQWDPEDLMAALDLPNDYEHEVRAPAVGGVGWVWVGGRLGRWLVLKAFCVSRSTAL